MKFIFILLLVPVLLSFVKCGLITDFLSSVSRDANKIHKNIHNALVRDHHNESTTEHPSRGIIGNVLGSIGKEIEKVSEIRKSIHQDIFNTLHKKGERKEEENQNSAPGNKTVPKIQDANGNENIDISKIATPSSVDKNNINEEPNNYINLMNATVVSTVANKTNAVENPAGIEATPLLIDIRHLPPRFTTLKPKINSSNTEAIETTSPVINVQLLSPTMTTLKPKTSTNNKNNIVYPNIAFNIPTDLSNTTDAAKISNKTSAEENPEAIETTSPMIDVRLLPINPTTAKLNTVTSEVASATSHKNDNKTQIIGDIVLFPDEARKRKIIAKEAEKTRQMEKNNHQLLSEIVFRDPDAPITTCPPGLVMEQGTCVPGRDSFKGECPSGTQRADDDTCEEVV